MKILNNIFTFIFAMLIGMFLASWTIYGIEMARAYNRYLPWPWN